jgi:hypothetical protein
VNISINDLHERLRLAGEEWADKDAAATLLEETKKSVLAQLMSQHPNVSNAAAETLALAAPEYARHVREMVEARKAANAAKVHYDSAKTWVDLMRTEAATKRAELGLR